MIKLSVVTIAKNEEKNIGACIRSAKGWVDEHIIVDDFSSERNSSKPALEGLDRSFVATIGYAKWLLRIKQILRICLTKPGL